MLLIKGAWKDTVALTALYQILQKYSDPDSIWYNNTPD